MTPFQGYEEFAYYGMMAIGFFMLAMLAVVLEFRFRRSIVVILFVTVLFGQFLTSVDLMSRPRPVELMLPWQVPVVEEAEVLAAHMREGQYIMLLLNWDGLDYPRYFKFPWDQEKAEQLQGAQNDAMREGNDGGVMLFMPFDETLDRREHPWAHPIPQMRTMPDKPNEAPEALEFDRPSDDA